MLNRKTRKHNRKKSKKYKKYIRKLRGGQLPTSKIFNFHCGYHYGDNMLNLKFLYCISDYLKNNQITINYYYDDAYIKNLDELERYVKPDIVSLKLIKDKPADSVELWMGVPINGIKFPEFDVFFPLLYSNILNTLKLNNLSIDTSLYQKEDYLLDIYKNLDPKFKNIDILIINSVPQSGQFDFDKVKMDDLCIRLSSKYKVVTTNHVNDSIVCTLDYKLKMQDIGAISTNVKYVIGVCTGPLIPCFNYHSKKNVTKWFILSSDNMVFKELNHVLISNIAMLNSIDL